MGDYVVKPPDRVFDRVFLATIVDRIDRNYALFKKIFDDEDFMCSLRARRRCEWAPSAASGTLSAHNLDGVPGRLSL